MVDAIAHRPFRTARQGGGDTQPTQGFSIARSMWSTVWILTGVGLAAIVCYAVSTSGNHLTYVGTGVLTAFGAGLSGAFFGFLLGIPRVVSSGEARQAIKPAMKHTGQTDEQTNTADEAAPTVDMGVARFAQSTNLAEISDWLTKLLLGAGLVSLTKLGAPTHRLFHAVAAGLATQVNGAAVVMAGGIVITYVALGFMATYVGTTVWYTRLLESTK